MQRKGFTMIELIFVIVILGILAAVAIPKLAATRDDAKISKALSEVSTLVSELGAYYTAQGKFDASDISSVTNVQNIYDDAACTTKSTAIASGTTYYYCTPDNSGALEDCVTITPNNTDGNLTIAAAANPAGNICKGVQNSSVFSSDLSGTKIFGGGRVSF